MRVLVTGAGGTLGGRLAALLSARHSVVAGRHEAPPPPGLEIVPLDLLSSTSVERALEASSPDAVLHAAAVADPDRCEREPEAAFALNAGASALLARLCRARGVRLVALSTDLVFSGERPGWTESDATGPLQVYGRTKLAGEEATRVEDPGSAVARVSLVLGQGFGRRPTASEAVAWRLAQGNRVRLFVDQFRTPIDADSLAEALGRLLENSATGTFHLGGPERVSRYDLGVRTAQRLGADTGLIEPALAAGNAVGAPRPADVSLDSGRARRELSWTPRALDDAIAEGRTRPPGP
jgi:dTDP-4-dehydrorhamnose reductase